MRTSLKIMASAILTLGVFCTCPVKAQQVVDRIVARVDEDIILQSDVDQLARYQLLVDGKSESQEQILERLIDQWIVRKEAEASRFPAADRPAFLRAQPQRGAALREPASANNPQRLCRMPESRTGRRR